MGLTDALMRVLGRLARKPGGWLGKIVFGHMAVHRHRPLTD